MSNPNRELIEADPEGYRAWLKGDATGSNNVDAILEGARSTHRVRIPDDAWWYAFGEDPEDHIDDCDWY